MDDRAITAKQLIELSKKHLEEQQHCVARQRDSSPGTSETATKRGYRVRASQAKESSLGKTGLS
jgi:hypothetical protein